MASHSYAATFVRYIDTDTYSEVMHRTACFFLLLLLPSYLFCADSIAPLVGYKKVMELNGDSAGGMIMPTDIAIGNDQRVYIVDSGNNRILVYANNGSYLFSFGSKGNGNQQLNSPVGITTTGDGRVLVADRGNNRIQIFNSEGSFLKSIPTIVGKSTVTPVDVAMDHNDKRILVTASGPHHRILVFNNKGEITGVWGKPGNNQGEFRYPATIAVSNEHETYVVDVFNTRVQVLDQKGKFLVSVGSWGVSPGHLFRPKGVAIENDGQILVSDSYLGVVQLYNSDTRFHAVLGINGEIARFDTPAGMIVDKQNRVYIAEVMSNRVTVLKPVKTK
ncbi:MAG: NHL repeat-containing protein [Candidatus Thiodiazotropha sp.]